MYDYMIFRQFFYINFNTMYIGSIYILIVIDSIMKHPLLVDEKFDHQCPGLWNPIFPNYETVFHLNPWQIYQQKQVLQESFQ